MNIFVFLSAGGKERVWKSTGGTTQVTFQNHELRDLERSQEGTTEEGARQEIIARGEGKATHNR
jgi:hypothetical protein